MNVFRIVFILLNIAMPASLYLSLIASPSEETLSETVRVLYIHVPSAWISVLAFVVAAFFAVRHLSSRNDRFFHLSKTSAMLGSLFIIIATVTGAIWAKATWGSFWNWDPRETSILFLLLIYGTYFILSANSEQSSRGKRSTSAYLLAATASLPFFVFIVPRMALTLHPDIISRQSGLALSPIMKAALFSSIGAFTLLYLVLFILTEKLTCGDRK